MVTGIFVKVVVNNFIIFEVEHMSSRLQVADIKVMAEFVVTYRIKVKLVARTIIRIHSGNYCT